MSHQSTASQGTIIFLNLPPKTFIGLDLLSFTSSPQFQGITNVPHGLHFLYSGTDASLSIRQGRWLNLTDRHACQILQWDAETESLDLLDEATDTAENVISSTTRSRRGMVDYIALQDATSDLVAKQEGESGRMGASDDEQGEGAEDDASEEDEASQSTAWPHLTSHISPSLLTRILTQDWITTSVSSAPSDTETIPGLSHLEAGDVLHQHPLYLLPIDLKQTWSVADVGRLRTDRARDRSWYLSTLIEAAAGNGKLSDGTTATGAESNTRKALGARHLLGELQFCFLLVLTLANYSCLEQWKRLLAVIFTCGTAVSEIPAYFLQVVRVLSEQMKRVEDVEGGLFELRDEAGSAWLRSNWARFRATVDEAVHDGQDNERAKALKDEVEGLQAFFEEKYSWASEKDRLKRGILELEDGERVEVSMAGVDEDEETGEYAPVVVET